MARTLFFPAVVVILASIALPVIATGATGAEMGTTLQTIQSLVNRGTAFEGTNIYAGDSLETGEKGVMRVRFDGSQVYLSSSTTVQVHKIEDGFSMDLTRGTVMISTAEGRDFQALVDGATIRPSGKHSTSAKIMWVSSQEFLVNSEHGDLEISLGGATRTVSSGTNYRAFLPPNDSTASDNPAPAAEPGGANSPTPSPAGSSRVPDIIFAAVAVAAAYGVVRVELSPSRF